MDTILDSKIIEKVRIFLLGIFVFSIVGTGSELILLEHFEDVWMWIPLALMGSSLLAIAYFLISRSSNSLQIFRIIMMLFVVSGIMGLWFHLKGNIEFEKEMYPSMKGLELIWESLKGATPALAPGTMIQLGLMGWLFTFKHPKLVDSSS